MVTEPELAAGANCSAHHAVYMDGSVQVIDSDSGSEPELENVEIAPADEWTSFLAENAESEHVRQWARSEIRRSVPSPKRIRLRQHRGNRERRPGTARSRRRVGTRCTRGPDDPGLGDPARPTNKRGRSR